MKASAMDRMRRVLSAIKMNEMVQLGAHMRQVEEARQEAARLRAQARNLAPAETAIDMVVQGQWQSHLDRHARAAEERARAAYEDSAPLRARLAKTLGQEDVTLKLIDQAKKQAFRAREARSEEEATKTKA